VAKHKPVLTSRCPPILTVHDFTIGPTYANRNGLDKNGSIPLVRLGNILQLSAPGSSRFYCYRSQYFSRCSRTTSLWTFIENIRCETNAGKTRRLEDIERVGEGIQVLIPSEDVEVNRRPVRKQDTAIIFAVVSL
jgi:hypothetical protein